MKIVVLDGYTLNPGDLSWQSLENLGECKIYDRTSLTDEKEIIERIGDAEIVFTNKTPISKKILDKCEKINYIGVLATGYNVVDIETAKKMTLRLRRKKIFPCAIFRLTEQISDLRNKCRCSICHCSAFGNLPPYGTPQ